MTDSNATTEETNTPPTIPSDSAVLDIFGDSFSALDGFAPTEVTDLARTAGFRISAGDSQEFVTDFQNRQLPGRMDLGRATLTALSHGKQTSRARNNEYHIVQGQMRIEADLFLKLEDEWVQLDRVLYAIFQQFAAADKKDDWPYERFVEFCKNSGYPIEGNYIFNFELLGAHEPAIKQYFPMFTNAGAIEINRQNKPGYIDQTFEFPQRGVGLNVVNLEIGRGDPTQSQLYNKTYTEDGQTFPYEGNVFVDPVSAQLSNFRRYMMHFKTSATLKRQAGEANDEETKKAIMARAQVHRSMSTMLLANFGGVHRGAQLKNDSEDEVTVEDTYYTNRVRCGRFGVQMPAAEGESAQIVEFNFWQPNAASATAITTTEGKTEAKVEEIDDDEEPF